MDRGIVATFMEITSCGSQTTAVRHLASCDWRIEAAIDLYFTAGADEPVRGPIPARSETLYDDKITAAAVDPVRASIPDRSETWYDDKIAAAAVDPARGPIPARSETWYDGKITAAAVDPARAPIPARSETLYESNPYAARSSTAPSVLNMKAEESPSPTSVPAVPVQVPSDLPEIKATAGWESDGNSGKKEEEEINGSDKEKEEDGAEADEDDAYDGTGTKEDDGYGSYGTEEEESYYGTEANSQKEESDDDVIEPGDSDSDYGMEALEGEQSPPRPRTEKTLKDLFRPPYELMYGGSFHDAKVHAARQDRWLVMNLQASCVFASHTHNRDLWANELIAQVVRSNFVFSLLEKTERYGDEGSKVCCFYKLGDDQLPAVLVLDPITGQMLAKWCGSMQPDDFLTNIGKYTESKPSTLSKPTNIVPRTTATPESDESAGSQEPAPTPESAAAADAQEPAPVPKLDKIETPAAAVVDYEHEPIEGEKMCKLRVLFPSGNVVTREFGSSRRVAALFAYCRSVVQDVAGTEQAFRIMRPAGRAFEELRVDDASFEDLGLNRATVSVVLDT